MECVRPCDLAELGYIKSAACRGVQMRRHSFNSATPCTTPVGSLFQTMGSGLQEARMTLRLVQLLLLCSAALHSALTQEMSPSGERSLLNGKLQSGVNIICNCSKAIMVAV